MKFSKLCLLKIGRLLISSCSSTGFIISSMMKHLCIIIIIPGCDGVDVSSQQIQRETATKPQSSINYTSDNS